MRCGRFERVEEEVEEKRGWAKGEICVWGKAHGERGSGAKGMGADVRAEKGEGTSPWI